MNNGRDDAGSRDRPFLLEPLFLLAAFVFVSCASAHLQNGQKALDRGNLKEAETHFETFAKNAPERDLLLAYLELGYVKRALGMYQESNRFFQKAEDEIEKWRQQPEFKISSEGLSLFTNLRLLPYRGRYRDRIMLNTYTALNYLQLGEYDKARVELRKAFEAQSEAVHENKERIEKAESFEESQAKSDPKVRKTRNNEEAQAKFEQAYSDLEQKFKPYANYVNPFCEWLQGIYYMAVPAEDQDFDRSQKSLERVIGMVENNKYLKYDLKLARKRGQGKELPNLTYVVFSTGNAPSLKQIRIDIPLFVVSNHVDYFGLAFPKLEKDDRYSEHLKIRTKNDQYRTLLLADMDSIVAREFKNRLPTIWTKTILGAVAKVSAAYAARRAAEQAEKQNPELRGLSTAVRIASSAYQAGVNQADTRTWKSLPKQFQYCRFETPESGEIQLSRPAGGSQTTSVRVKTDQFNFVFVRSYDPDKPLDVSTITLSVSP